MNPSFLSGGRVAAHSVCHLRALERDANVLNPEVPTTKRTKTSAREMRSDSARASIAPALVRLFLSSFGSIRTLLRPLAFFCKASAAAERAFSVVAAMNTSHSAMSPNSRFTASCVHRYKLCSIASSGDSLVGQSSLSSPSSRARMWMAMTGAVFPHSFLVAKESARFWTLVLGRIMAARPWWKSSTSPSLTCGFVFRMGVKYKLLETETILWLSSDCLTSEHPRSSNMLPSIPPFMIWNM
mmetsp:Transcript_58428/g.104977  ORF Transcript_58428/g.104977 Transcript_58428/m.104977 type:complete len:241 (+) Transcript_58428:274-996(+)